MINRNWSIPDNLLANVNEASIVDLLQKLIRIESTNPPGNERDLANFLADFFAKAGLEPELFEYEGKRANLITRIKGSGKKPGLIFSAHMDTVPAGEVAWKFPPFSGTLDDGKIYGRGAADTSMTHQPNENVEVSRLVQAVKIYLLIASWYLA